MSLRDRLEDIGPGAAGLAQTATESLVLEN